MCVEVLVVPEGRTVETVGELAALVGGVGGVVALLPGKAPALGAADCLCPVDLDATAAAAGYRQSRDLRNPFGVVWERPPRA